MLEIVSLIGNICGENCKVNFSWLKTQQHNKSDFDLKYQLCFSLYKCCGFVQSAVPIYPGIYVATDPSHASVF